MKKFSLWTMFRMRFLPRTLWWRSFLIMIVPVVLIVTVSSIVFFDTHWQSVGRRLAIGVVDDIQMVIDARKKLSDKEMNLFLNIVNRNLGYTFKILPPQNRYYHTLKRQTIWKTSELRPIIKDLNIPYVADDLTEKSALRLLLFHNEYTLEVIIPYKRFFSSTIYVFGLWTLLSSMILVLISTLFMRNQVRPIVSLAEAAENFGLGRENDKIKPAGALEVRRATLSFLKMRDRIRRHLDERTRMLAGISHDLRTPLTRMRLQLALMGNNEDCRELLDDVEEMERMINGYLSFVKGEDGETARRVVLNDIIDSAVSCFVQTGLNVRFLKTDSIEITLRPDAVKRCLTNLLSNAQRYAKNVTVSLLRKDRFVEIIVEDDGPGIPKEKREDVFKAFYRLDESRNSQTGGIGLGLSITKDIVLSHGGNIVLEQSSMGGLKVLLRFPEK